MTGFINSARKLDPKYSPTRRIDKYIQSNMPKPPKETAPIAAPLEPTVDDARRIEEEQARLRRRKGFASTFLTSMFGRPGPNSASGFLSKSSDSLAGGGGRVQTPRNPPRANSA